MSDTASSNTNGTKPAKPPIDPNVRDYLAAQKVAPILEAFVTDLVQEKPENVLKFMGTWARRMDNQVSGEGDPDTPKEEGFASSTVDGAGDEEYNALKLQSMAVRQSWAILEEKGGAEELEQLAKTFFTVVTTQHRSLNRTLLKDVDLEPLGHILIELLAGVVKGTKDDGALREAAATYGSDKELEQRHYDYFITGMLSALSIHLKDDWAVVSEPWRVLLTEVTNIVRDTIAEEKRLDDGRDDSAVLDGDRASNEVKDSWKQIAHKKKDVGDLFLTLLTVQHPSLKRTVFKGVDLDAAATKLVELLDGVVTGTVEDDFLEALGMQYGVEYGVDPDKHASYFITTMLTTLRSALSEEHFTNSAEPWRLVLTNITEAVTKGINALESQQTMSVEVADPATQAAITTAPTDVVLESWNAIEDKKQFAATLFNVLQTQHAVIKRSLLKDVGIEALIETHFLPLFQQYVEGGLDDDALAAKAKEFGADKNIQQRFYHYFITGVLTALSLSMPKADFDNVSELWRLKVTHLTEVVEKALTEAEDQTEL